MTTKICSTIGILGVLFFHSAALAAFSNTNSLLMGELVAGIGGAGTAVVGDVAASPFYNPATLAQLEGSAFSAAVGIYKKFDVLYGNEEDFTKAPLRVNQGFFRSLPASTGSVIKAGDYSLAFSVVVPDYSQFKGDLRSDTTNISTLTVTDESLWVGGSIAKRLNDTDSWGFTLYYTARNLTRSISDRTTTDADHSQVFTEDKTMTENALVPIFGYHQKINDQWAWGASIRTSAIPILGRATIFRSSILVDTAASPPVKFESSNNPEKSTRVVIPGLIRLGTTWQPDPSWLLSLDLSLSEGISYNDLEDASLATKVVYRSTGNVSIGIEKKFRDWLYLRTGVYTNMSTHPDPEPDLRQEQQDHVDMLGFSANFVFIAGQKIHYTFGGYYVGGKGRSMQRINQNPYDVVPKTEQVFTMLMGTSFFF